MLNYTDLGNLQLLDHPIHPGKERNLFSEALYKYFILFIYLRIFLYIRPAHARGFSHLYNSTRHRAIPHSYQRTALSPQETEFHPLISLLL